MPPVDGVAASKFVISPLLRCSIKIMASVVPAFCTGGKHMGDDKIEIIPVGVGWTRQKTVMPPVGKAGVMAVMLHIRHFKEQVTKFYY